MNIHPDDLATLEALIDRAGLSRVIEAMARICSDKGEHLRSNWQDEHGGKLWDKKMMFLDNLARKLELLS